MNTIKKGSKGEDVQVLQKKLNLTDDGIFGPKTEEAVKKFQKEHSLVADGIVGPLTWEALGVSTVSNVSTSGSKEKKREIHVILNYGHAKSTPGKRSPLYSTLSKTEQRYFAQYPQFGVDRYYEYLSNRVIGRQIARQLRANGWLVDEIEQEGASGLTEINTMTKRLVKNYGANNCLVVSIHSNAASAKDNGWANAQGWCIYTTKGQDKSDKLADCIYKYADEIFVKNEGRKIRRDMKDGDADQEENFSVIWNAKQLGIAGVLTENFFFNDKEDLKYIVSENGQNAIVKTHVMGIEEYIHKYMLGK